ncbi:unnamed protein product [Bursaphelenchus okinawaensis]|uniref:Uncharacterized protein n=1 Tax=Bursaphelenchus okinawaensis TaxID=465554 RepID=A0A811K9D2_9BILA|nr:unnamed protein product [Bursaphelenchus okinawaensis]CAG9097129.1 unnamed protein product [Bursaphelenchus okinawaensis]
MEFTVYQQLAKTIENLLAYVSIVVATLAGVPLLLDVENKLMYMKYANVLSASVAMVSSFFAYLPSNVPTQAKVKWNVSLTLVAREDYCTCLVGSSTCANSST